MVKNKLAPPFRKVQMDIDFGHGISRTGELVDLGVQTGALGKSGAWYTCVFPHLVHTPRRIHSRTNQSRLTVLTCAI